MGLPRWKREQAARQKKKFALVLRLAMVALLLVFLSLAGLFFARELRSAKLPQNLRASLVLRTSPVMVVSFDPQGELTILSIPEKTYVEVPHGFGSYRLGATWDLGEQEKMGGELLAETVQELLGVPIDGWVGMKNGQLSMTGGKEEILQKKNSLTSWGIFLKPQEIVGTLRNLQTNLTIFDLAKVWFWAKNTRFDKIHFLNMDETPALSLLVLADGSQAKTADQTLLDTATKGLFEDTKVVNEQILIEVLNGGEKPGLAAKVARFITNLGGKVVNISNSSEEINQCRLKGEAKVRESSTAWQLKRIFNCQVLADKPDSRADLQIIIGDEYWKKLFQKEAN